MHGEYVTACGCSRPTRLLKPTRCTYICCSHFILKLYNFTHVSIVVLIVVFNFHTTTFPLLQTYLNVHTYPLLLGNVYCNL